MLQWGAAGSQCLNIQVTNSAVGSEEEFSQARKATSEILETSGAALERGTPAQVQLLQHPDERRPVPVLCFGALQLKGLKVPNPPAAVDQLHQTSIGQVSAAPQVQRAQESGTSRQHAGHNIVVFDLRERGSIFNDLHVIFK